jgi:hypothetical protein
MAGTQRIPNPHWVGSPAHMSDGRLFTNYRANCSLLPTKLNGMWADYDRRMGLMNTGAIRVTADRSFAAMAAGRAGCVDTMVPELNKRVYDWQSGVQGLAHRAGVGTGRLYLPGQPELMSADPDIVAAATIPDSMLPGTYNPNPFLYAPALEMPSVATPVVPPRRNRYSAPYGNP